MHKYVCIWNCLCVSSIINIECMTSMIAPSVRSNNNKNYNNNNNKQRRFDWSFVIPWNTHTYARTCTRTIAYACVRVLIRIYINKLRCSWCVSIIVLTIQIMHTYIYILNICNFKMLHIHALFKKKSEQLFKVLKSIKGNAREWNTAQCLCNCKTVRFIYQQLGKCFHSANYQVLNVFCFVFHEYCKYLFIYPLYDPKNKDLALIN